MLTVSREKLQFFKKTLESSMIGKINIAFENPIFQDFKRILSLQYSNIKVHFKFNEPFNEQLEDLIMSMNQVAVYDNCLVLRESKQCEQIEGYITLQIDGIYFCQNIHENIISSQAAVYRAISTDIYDKSQYAIKKYEITSVQQLELIKREIKLMRALQASSKKNDHILCYLHQVIQDQNQVYLILDYSHYGDLSKLIQEKSPLQESEVKHIILQLLFSLALMHSKEIIHRDLKPDNILVMDRDSLQVSIADFGLACFNHDNTAKSIKCGSPGFMAPEILRDQLFDLNSDVFSLGCIMYSLITKGCIFPGKTIQSKKYSGLIRMFRSIEVNAQQKSIYSLFSDSHAWFENHSQYISERLHYLKLKNPNRKKDPYAQNSEHRRITLKSTKMECMQSWLGPSQGIGKKVDGEQKTQSITNAQRILKLRELCNGKTNNNSQVNLCEPQQIPEHLNQSLNEEIDENLLEEQTPRAINNGNRIASKITNRLNLSIILLENKHYMSNLNTPVKQRYFQ
ncbi:serine threonine protein kinase [Stylonychia lemnae]|uniref:Serine threonine protein kinase n=1 Tax=Stylonychia lemnae TaxID=5949 RepID=A0A078A440_STYLE|nr:serine threonine protein kinase [Stylonychia lemnae]|eukprot:CDW75529.1 serine threonine protein kinase [Stylonychia lemnae]